MEATLGLSDAEATRRRAAGQGNSYAMRSSRPLVEILRDNVLTFINLVLFGIGAVLLAIGRGGDAAVTAGLVLINVVVGVVQEVRAKRKLDQIALLTRPRVRLLRAGVERAVDPAEVVVGDVLLLAPGDQVIADGQMVGAGQVGMDESLLTGESDSILKRPGDAVYSGSFCVSGAGAYEAQRVGRDSSAYRLAEGARAYRRVLTPLQRQVNLTIRLLVVIASFLGALLIIESLIQRVSLVEGVRMGAVVAGLVPNGLILMIIVAYAMGAIRIAGQGALVQQSNAVESLSNVTVVCLDKTGTLTANRIRLHEVTVLGDDEARVKRQLGDFAASASGGTRTSDALIEALGGARRPVAGEIPFSSARKWSALAFADDESQWVLAFGAPEMLGRHVPEAEQLAPRIQAWADEGYRVLLFAGRRGARLGGSADEPELPADLEPLALISFTDELRPEAGATLQEFARAGVDVKVISGDSPDTVAALARQAGLGTGAGAISGAVLDDLTDEELADVAEANSVFGRITPQQKERLVGALVRRGRYVAMIGDGVNDVLSLKRAQVGIAMRSGTQATRAVADVVLLNDSFGALPPAIIEGQRIRNGMDDILKLFLTRVLAVALLIASVAIVGAGFPFSPKHNSILTFLTVGIPTFALAVWAKPGVPKANAVRLMLAFVVPAALMLALVDLVAYLYFVLQSLPPGYADLTGRQMQQAMRAAEIVARSGVTTVSVCCGLMLMVFVQPPTRFWTGGDELSGDWRPTILAGVLAVVYVVLSAVPATASFFELVIHRPVDYAVIAVLFAAWTFALRYFWRHDLLSRFLDTDVSGPGRQGG